jgi:serine O-acetyltransferase
MVFHKIIETLTGVSIAPTAEIGPGLYIGHYSGIFVGRDARIGADCSLSQGVTIGYHRGGPHIGDSVYLAPGAKVYGPVRIGDNVSIGPNAVVDRDVPENSVVRAPDPEVLPKRS